MCAGEGKGSGPYRCCLFLHSGSFDRVYHAMGITNVVLARGGEVHILFSYGALPRLVKGRTDDIAVDDPPGSLKVQLQRNLDSGVLDSLHEMLQTGKRFGCLRIYACSASMAILNIARGELIDEVDASMGMVGFMDLVREADLTLYI